MNQLQDYDIKLQRKEFNELNQIIQYSFQKGEITAQEMQRQSMKAEREYNEVVASIMRNERQTTHREDQDTHNSRFTVLGTME